MAMKKMTMDGNMAAAWVSYAFTEAAAIYPITPSSDMAQYTDEWAAVGKKNMFGEPVKIVEMQSEGGAAGAVHGSLQAGALTTTYTASQGLLLMVPNMYKIAGELLPGVFHVSARNIATHALSIFGEHSDVYAARQTGFAILASESVQEVMDLGAVAHLASLKSSVPFMHFFDGFRTSHEIQKVEAWTEDYADLKKLIDKDSLSSFRKNALNPENPVTRGTAQNPDIYFQVREASNNYYNAVPEIVENYMNEISKLTGRDYKPFNYYGAADADRVIVAMGSVTSTVRETVDYLNANGEKVGAIIVRLYRPFSAKHFLTVLPKTVKKISVLDRTKECGALGEPLYLDIRSVLFEEKDAPQVVGGRYGLSSKDTTPQQIVAVYENLKLDAPKNQFTIGIIDDVTHTNLELGAHLDTVPKGTVECKFWGLGADGTVGANKNSIKIIGDNTEMFAQGYFSYDSKKSGGVTVSHLRFGKEEINSSYLVTNANFVSCSVPSYLGKYDLLKGLRPGGTFLLNSIWDEKEIIAHLPTEMKKFMADNDIKFYVINATEIANGIGLGSRTNTIMQSAFFKLSEVIPYDQAVELMKKAIFKSYSNKGEAIVNMNNEAVDNGASALNQVAIDPSWKNLKVEAKKVEIHGLDNNTEPKLKAFMENVAAKVNLQEGDDLPVSVFMDHVNGTLPAGTTQFEKRGIAVDVPEWKSENCIQCNQCAYVCPHAVIRPFLLDENEVKNAPADMKMLKPIGKGMDGLQYKLQVSPLDCTGCGACVVACPAKTKALVMEPLESQLHEDKNWSYVENNVTYKSDLFPNLATVKNSQFAQPLFEFSGACSGCGETSYIKAITQLFGDRMMVANATGCSSIFGGSAPSTPYRKNAEGKGVAWANSLFEDNAEFGFGMNLGTERLRSRLKFLMETNMSAVAADMKEAFAAWVESFEDIQGSKAATKALLPLLEKDGSELSEEILELKQYLIKKSVWIIGGDGWAYDIGFGGLDHVLASNEDVNVLVLDTEVYSNTGGQSSKASPAGSVAKFAASGKKTRKKDLGRIAMSYGYVYVAQVAMGSNQSQFLKAVAEAEAYPGPSIIIAYAPCIAHGIKGGMSGAQPEEKFAVESGYWHLYRYNPMLEDEGKNPFKLESKAPDFTKYLDFLNNEVRYTTLTKQFPKEAERLFAQSLSDAKWRYKQYRLMNEMDYADKE
ncbi:MAG: pyruvate:ferredoxin (flavodoxin) oxidoreductase [Bacteriovoracaceae bacterium]|nr:pyruvate:ferredoxin (flavodoxin) oxidoreductase [Bacteriovoracaceae bacterium]